MNQNSLRRLSKKDLMTMLRDQEIEIEELKKKNAALRKKLESKEIAIANSGSLAVASMAVTKIFQEAQLAADIYLENVMRNAKAVNNEDKVSSSQEVLNSEESCQNPQQ